MDTSPISLPWAPSSLSSMSKVLHRGAGINTLDVKGVWHHFLIADKQAGKILAHLNEQERWRVIDEAAKMRNEDAEKVRSLVQKIVAQIHVSSL